MIRVLIAGGGSAGWIAAATLNFALNADGARRVAIELVESPTTPRIGVGEATIPTIRDMLIRFGLGEADFMRSCNATFKHAIRFDDWSHPGSRYYHPFHRYLTVEASRAAGEWLASDGTPPYAELVSAQPALIAANRSPRRRTDPEFVGAVPYAYHMDAELFAEALATHCTRHGVRRTIGHIAGLDRAEDGKLRAVTLTDGRSIGADLFVDCTGFRALLAHGTGAGSDWIDQSSHLLCNRAVTLRVPEVPARFTPPSFTRARALSSGWCWDIGLSNRRGRGYVYSDRFSTPEAAEAELRIDEGAAAAGLEARHLSFSVGRRRTPWASNVVALGLAAGFLEPLESTGLFMADHGARLLLAMFPPDAQAASAPALGWRYNALMSEMHDELLDFIQLHYAVAGRRDTAFWRAATDPERLTDRLRNLLNLWELRPPGFVDFSNRFSPFNHANYEFILLGSGWRPGKAPPGNGPAPVSSVTSEHTRALRESLPAVLPSAG